MLRRALKFNKFLKTQKQNIVINGFKTQGTFEENKADHVCHQIEPIEDKPNVLQKTKNITFIDFTGKKTTVQGYIGQTILEVAEKNGLPLFGECGGSCGCIGCKVQVVDEFYNDLVGMTIYEEKRLESVDDINPSTRLGCQVVIDEQTPDGLVISIPPRSLMETMDNWCKS
eukprot:gene576-8086_t